MSPGSGPRPAEKRASSRSLTSRLGFRGVGPPLHCCRRAPPDALEAVQLEPRILTQGGQPPTSLEKPCDAPCRAARIFAAHAAPMALGATLGYEGEQLRYVRRSFAPCSEH